ncbi:MAG: hypothetical protein HC857_01320 [Synechococcales cyanobacterium RU_4_20]|nr:hypothetical protein [Synechococcales cyanobacterium RU_4_20]
MLPPRLPHGLHHLKDMAYGLALTLGLIGGPAVLAQTPVSLESCAPPASGEYLLLVVVQAPNAEEKLRQTLPPSVKAPTCNYLGTRVARMGGFRRPEDADAWASYLREVAALPAFIAQPPKAGEVRAKVGTEVSTGVPAIANVPSPQVLPPKSSPQVLVPPLGAAPVGETAQPMSLPASSAIPKPDLSARGSVSRYPNATVSVPAPGSAPPISVPPLASASFTPSFTPKSLAAGYVVLVDYANQPAIATQVQSALQRPVGLVSYAQRPYLLVQYSADSATAVTTLRNLTQRGFQTLMVDSQGITVLTEAVR